MVRSFVLLLLFAYTLFINSYLINQQDCRTATASTITRMAAFNINELDEFQQRVHSISEKACYKAGENILKGSNMIDLSLDVISKIGSRDIVTQVDKDCQEIIRDVIISAFPDHQFLGEEDIEPGIEASTTAIRRFQEAEHLWIVDPIDGTTNFAHGIPICGVIIAYASKGEVMHGCIYDPHRQEIFTAWKGKGAYLNGRQIKCCQTPVMKDSVLCTGSPPNIKSLDACLRAMNLISKEVRTIRLFGSAATMLSWTACGRVSGYFEADLNAWDLAAGSLLVCFYIYLSVIY